MEKSVLRQERNLFPGLPDKLIESWKASCTLSRQERELPPGFPDNFLEAEQFLVSR